MTFPKAEVYWYTQKKPQITTLTKDMACETLVIGGGLAGLHAAQKLKEAGQEVAVIEKSFCGGGASGKSSGFVTPDSELELANLTASYGPEKAKKLWEFVCQGVELIRKNIQTNQIACDYQVQDSLFVSNTRFRHQRIHHEHEARQALNYRSTFYEEPRLSEVLGAQHYHGGVRYPDTFGINGYLYSQALKEILQNQGVKIFENSPALKIAATGATTDRARITAKNILVCVDRFSPELMVLTPFVYQAQTFLGITKPLTPQDVKRIFPQAPLMVWDTDIIYQYYRLAGENRLLIGAASVLYAYLPFEIKKPLNVVKKMYRYLKSKFPWLQTEIEYLWPGLIGVSKDFVPLAGQDASQNNLYFVSCATGLPWAAALGRYAAEKITGGRDDFDREFTPQRKYPVDRTWQTVLGKPPSFALSHLITKYL